MSDSADSSAASSAASRSASISDVHKIVDAAIEDFRRTLSRRTPALAEVPAASPRMLSSDSAGAGGNPLAPTTRDHVRPKKFREERPDNLQRLGIKMDPGFDPERVVVGVLQKWVNYAHGNESRLFMLERDVLKYYRIHGKSKAAVTELTAGKQHLLIGDRITRLRNHEVSKSNPHYDTKCLGELHVAVIRLRVSKSDPCKFNIYSGTKVLDVRAECQEDLRMWLSAVESAKRFFGSPAVSVPRELSGPEADIAEFASLRAQLESLSASPVIIDACALWSRDYDSQAQEAHQHDRDRIDDLEDALKTLHEQKRELERQLVGIRTDGVDGGGELSQMSEGEEDEDSGDEDAIDSRRYPRQLTLRTSDEQDDDDEDGDEDDEFFEVASTFGGSSRRLSAASETVLAVDDTPSAGGGSLVQLPPPVARRQELPIPKRPRKKPSLWSLVAQSVGKDVSRICLPVTFNEPTSLLQTIAEDLEYSELLEQANECSNSCERLAYVAAFVASGYSSTDNRLFKPFNPLLAETYECVREDKKFRFFSEKVVHHPTVIAWHSESIGSEVPAYEFYGNIATRNKFTGSTMDVYPTGTHHIKLPNHGDHYTYTKITSCLHNIIVGSLWLEHHGTLEIKNEATGDVARLKFKPKGWGIFNKEEDDNVVGTITDKSNKVVMYLAGKWEQSISLYFGKPDKTPPGRVLWQRTPLPDNAAQMYNMTRFAITLNEMLAENSEKTAKTDTRFRPDQRLLESGDFEDADEEKHRMEQKQRASRKLQETSGQEHKPRWFKNIGNRRDMGREGPDCYGRWEYGSDHPDGGLYWDARELQGNDWKGCKDIFGDGDPEISTF